MGGSSKLRLIEVAAQYPETASMPRSPQPIDLFVRLELQERSVHGLQQGSESIVSPDKELIADR